MAELLSLSLSLSCQLPAIDIVDKQPEKEGKLQEIKKVEVKKVNLMYYDAFFNNENKEIQDNKIFYLRVSSFNLDNNSVQLTTLPKGAEEYSPHGFMINKDNYITKLPLFCAKLYPQENWYERDVYFTTADRGEDYLKNADLLRRCFIFTCLSRYNHCLSFEGSDGRFYRNELCFDEGTIASEDLTKFDLQPEDQELIDEWKKVLKEAKKTKNYNNKNTYGTYQIDVELNTFIKDKNGRKQYDYIELNTALDGLKSKLKSYYKTHIQDLLFEYELLK